MTYYYYYFVFEKLDKLSLFEDLDKTKKLVGFAADGAANMMGCSTGLTTLLKDNYPFIIIVHCLTHVLKLAYKDAMKESTVYSKLQTLVQGIFCLL